jgi:hypothetical protein
MTKPVISEARAAAFEQWIAKLALDQLLEDIQDQQVELHDTEDLARMLAGLFEDAEAQQDVVATDLTDTEMGQTHQDQGATFSSMIEQLAFEQMLEDIELSAADEADAIESARRSDLLIQLIGDAISTKRRL